MAVADDQTFFQILAQSFDDSNKLTLTSVDPSSGLYYSVSSHSTANTHFKLCHLNGDETCYFKCEEFGDNYVLTIAANDQSRERQVQMEPYDCTNQWQKFKITIPTEKQHGSLSDTNQQQPPCRVAIYSADESSDESYLLYPGKEYVKALPYKVTNPFLFVFKPL